MSTIDPTPVDPTLPITGLPLTAPERAQRQVLKDQLGNAKSDVEALEAVAPSADEKAALAAASAPAAGNPYLTDSAADALYAPLAHASDTGNPHAVTAAQAGAAPSSHVGAGGSEHANAVPSGAAGFMSGADKSKLDGVEAGAEANDVASVFGRTGTVVAQAGDYTAADVGAAPAAHVGAGGAEHPAVTDVAAGFAPASGGGTVNFLRADGTWTAPPGGSVANPPSAKGSLWTHDGATTTELPVGVTDGHVLTVAAAAPDGVQWAPPPAGGSGIAKGAPFDVDEFLAVSNAAGAGEANTRGITVSAVSGHLADTGNPHAVTAAQAGAAPVAHVGAGGAEHAAVTDIAAGFAPASGGGTANYLRADGTWTQPPGLGDVTGPGSSGSGNLPSFSGTTGKVVQDSGIPAADVGRLSIGQVWTAPNTFQSAPRVDAAVNPLMFFSEGSAIRLAIGYLGGATAQGFVGITNDGGTVEQVPARFYEAGGVGIGLPTIVVPTAAGQLTASNTITAEGATGVGEVISGTRRQVLNPYRSDTVAQNVGYAATPRTIASAFSGAVEPTAGNHVECTATSGQSITITAQTENGDVRVSLADGVTVNLSGYAVAGSQPTGRVHHLVLSKANTKLVATWV